jgi:hypothetical protein
MGLQSAKLRGFQIQQAHVSNPTDYEGESFHRGSEDEGVQMLTAICKAAWMAA